MKQAMFLQAKTAHFVRKLVGDPPQTPLVMARTKKPLHQIKTKRICLRLTVDEFLIVAERAKKEELKIVEYIRKKSAVRVMAFKEVSQERKDLVEGLVNSGKRFNSLTKKANCGIHRPQELYWEMNELWKILLALQKELV